MNRSSLAIALLTGAAGAALACWKPEVDPSVLTFIATQAGAPFEGVFRNFEGEICLDPANPEAGHIQVSVDTASVDSGLPEFDDALRGPLFFDSARWPKSTFTSSSIKALGDHRFQVTGKFTLRDVTREIQTPFTLVPSGADDATLEGETTIKRLDYHVGQGEWADTQWVGDEVILKFAVKLKK